MAGENKDQGAALRAGLSQVEPASAVSPLRASIPSAWGEDQTIHRGWVIIREPNRIPDLHIPYPQSEAGMDAALEALTKLRPEGTSFTVARLTWDGDLWIEDGAERLAEKALLDSLTPEDWAEIYGRHEDEGNDEEAAPCDGSGEAGETAPAGSIRKDDSAVPEGQAPVNTSLPRPTAPITTDTGEGA